MVSPAITTTIHARCHCKTHNYDFNVPVALLPLHGSHCHCNMCRLTNGGYFESYVRLPQSVPPYTDKSPPLPTLIKYQCTTQRKRWFCSKCGTKLFFNWAPNGWSINVGALETLTGIVRFDVQCYVREAPTLDGIGFFDVLQDSLPYFLGDDEDEGAKELTSQEKIDLIELTQPTKNLAIDPTKRLEASCYCGRVRALISRPVVHSGNSWLSQIASKSLAKWKLSICACGSCRLSTGAAFCTFIFTPTEHIEWLPSKDPGSGPVEDGAEGEDDWRAKAGMTWWRSSDHVIRGFCGTCGASVHCQSEDMNGRSMKRLEGETWSSWGLGKDAVSNIYAGILRASNKDGERVSDWLEFQPGIDFVEDLTKYDVSLKEHLTKGMQVVCERQALWDQK